MRTLNATQQAVVDAASKEVFWLFDVNNQYLNFDASTCLFIAGDTITGANSGATATIDRVVYTSTTAGKLMLSSVSGTFEDDEGIHEDGTLANGTLQGDEYYWSTKSTTDPFGSGQAYTFKVIPDSFNGITINSPLSQYGTHAPNKLSFEITNKANALTASDFEDATIYLKLVLARDPDTAIICDYRYVVDRAHPYYGKIRFECKDFLSAHIDSDYPNTPVVDDLFDPGTADLESINEDPFCVPVPFGTCYIPLKCITDSGYARGYLLGPDDYTYTITEVSSPRAFDASQSWSSDDADFRQVTKTDRFTPSTDYKTLHPFLIKMDANNYSGTHTGANDAAILTDSTMSWTVDELIGLRVVNETDGSAGYITDNDATTITATLSGGTDNNWDTDDEYYITASGLWKYNGAYQSILAKFSRSDTSALTSPEEVIEFAFEDKGIGTDFIDTGAGSSFETAGTTFSGWGLTFNGAFFYKRRFAEVIAELLTCCHSTIDVEDKVKLRVLSKTSQKTIDSSDITGNSFRFSYLTKEQNDSGYVAFHESGEPQDVFIKLLLAAKSTTNNPSSDIVSIPFVQDSEMVQKLGQLYYQRKLGREANISFTGKSTLLALQPNDVITINHTNYGASFDSVIESVTINRDVSVQIRCIKYKYDLDDWADLGYGTVSLTTDNATYWSPTIGGPDSVTPTSGNVPHVVPGKLRIGATGSYILIDDIQKSIKSSNYISGYAGTGFYLDPDLLEVGNIACRGIFRSAVIQYDNVFAYAGNQIVAKGADVLATDMTAADNSTVEIENDSGASAWAAGDILRMKDASDDEWFEVASVVGNVYTCTRDKKAEYGAGANPAWTAGQAIVNYGQSGDGGIFMTASETNAPYLSIFTHAGSPWDGVTTRLRLGNLNSFLDYASDLYGIAIGETNKYLKYDPTNGLRIAGNITLNTTGSIRTEGKDDYADTTAGIFIGYDTDAYKFNLGDDTNYIKWDGSDLTIEGGIETDHIEVDTDGYVRTAGKTSYSDTDAGFWLGYDTSAYKLYIGDATYFLKWTGSDLTSSAGHLLKPAIAGNYIETDFGSDSGQWTTSYVKKLEGHIGRSGTWRIKFGIKGSPAYHPPATTYGRIYKNGVAHGTERATTSTSYEYFTEDLVFASGDFVQVYGKRGYLPGGTVFYSYVIGSAIASGNPIVSNATTL